MQSLQFSLFIVDQDTDIEAFILVGNRADPNPAPSVSLDSGLGGESRDKNHSTTKGQFNFNLKPACLPFLKKTGLLHILRLDNIMEMIIRQIGRDPKKIRAGWFSTGK